MTPEDKLLLLQDLCARIPCHPKGLVVNACTGAECEEWLNYATFTMFANVTNNCHLYLRPMSSMTEEEREEYHKLCDKYYDIYFDSVESIDWLNAHHFDFRGLIEKGLALESPEGMY